MDEKLHEKNFLVILTRLGRKIETGVARKASEFLVPDEEMELWKLCQS